MSRSRRLVVSTPVATLMLMVPLCMFLSAHFRLQVARKVEWEQRRLTLAAYDRANTLLWIERQKKPRDSQD